MIRKEPPQIGEARIFRAPPTCAPHRLPCVKGRFPLSGGKCSEGTKRVETLSAKLTEGFRGRHLQEQMRHRQPRRIYQICRGGWVLPCPHKARYQNCTTSGDRAQCFEGADASVRPMGNDKFVAAFRKNGRAPCGSIWASTPTNILRIRRGAFVFVGAYRRADRVASPCARSLEGLLIIHLHQAQTLRQDCVARACAVSCLQYLWHFLCRALAVADLQQCAD